MACQQLADVGAGPAADLEGAAQRLPRVAHAEAIVRHEAAGNPAATSGQGLDVVRGGDERAADALEGAGQVRHARLGGGVEAVEALGSAGPRRPAPSAATTTTAGISAK